MYQMKDFVEALSDASLGRKFAARRSDKSISWKTEKAYALEIIKGSEKLQKATPKSVQLAMMSLAAMGLSLDTARGHAYLIPRKNTAYATPSYKGLRYLAMLTPEIMNIQCELVRERDPTFEHGMDRNGPYVEHQAARDDRGEVTHAYCVTFFVGGTRQVEVMERWELDKVKEAAKKAQNGTMPFTWIQWEGEMQKKAVARRGSKHWPIKAGRVAEAIRALDKAEPVVADQQEVGCITETQAENLVALIKKQNLDASVTTKNICAIYGVERLRDLPKADLTKIRRGITNRGKSND